MATESKECDYCGDEFDEDQFLNKHMKSYHPTTSLVKNESETEGGQLSNEYCEQLIIKQEREYQPRHTISQESFECRVCGKTVTSRKKLMDHLRALHNDPADCELCGQTCPSKKRLLEHKRRKHSNEQFKCDMCEETFKRKDTLSKHFKVCHKKKMRTQEHKRENGDDKIGMEQFLEENIKPYELNTHDKTDSKENNLEDGQRSYEEFEIKHEQDTKQEMHECHICDSKFTLRRKLSDHVRGVHTGPASCELCGKLCSSKKKLLSHNRRVHGNEQFSCENCEEIFTRKDALPRHLKVCRGKKKKRQMDNREFCSLCKDTFSFRSSLRRHVRKNHPEEFKTSALNAKYLRGTRQRTWSCVKCDYVAKIRCRLKKHIAAKHRSEVVYKCGACDFSSTSFASLKRHRKDMHRGEKLFKCKECAKSFAFNDSLRTHIQMRHANADTFSCTRCAKEFAWKGSAERHELGCGRLRPEVPWEQLSVSGKKWRVKRILGEFGKVLS